MRYDGIMQVNAHYINKGGDVIMQVNVHHII